MSVVSGRRVQPLAFFGKTFAAAPFVYLLARSPACDGKMGDTVASVCLNSPFCDLILYKYRISLPNIQTRTHTHIYCVCLYGAAVGSASMCTQIGFVCVLCASYCLHMAYYLLDCITMNVYQNSAHSKTCFLFQKQQKKKKKKK